MKASGLFKTNNLSRLSNAVNSNNKAFQDSKDLVIKFEQLDEINQKELKVTNKENQRLNSVIQCHQSQNEKFLNNMPTLADNQSHEVTLSHITLLANALEQANEFDFLDQTTELIHSHPQVDHQSENLPKLICTQILHKIID